jgi:hypothetical protein
MVASNVIAGKFDSSCDFGHITAGKRPQLRFDVQPAAAATG